MKILFAGSEALPFASTGGLGDVLGSLPSAIAHAFPYADVRVALPLYSSISHEYRSEMTLITETQVRLSWRVQYCGIYSLLRDGVTYYFIDNEYYFKRPTLYGNYDDGERFAFFSRAVLELMDRTGFFPDILHANDWQTAASVIYLKSIYSADARYRPVRAVYTIHNIEYQGIYGMDILGDVFGLGPNMRGVIEYDGNINLTKGAIVCADAVTTVSPQYARELQTEYYSHGLYHILRLYREKLFGIINGIDTTYYNPETDPALPKNYSANDPSGKAVCKEHIQRLTGLAVCPNTPLVAMISRLAEHKGFDLVTCVIEEFLKDDVQFILLGTGDKALEDYFSSLAARYPGKVAVLLQFNKELSKQIYAGADIFLMPSKSEPCGLSQMIASRYGAIPVVRETGGLYDTIKPYNPENDSGNGFTFANYNAHDMLYVLRQATALYRDKDKFTKLMLRAMKCDFSWDSSAKQYMELYKNLPQ